jgi:hypothetical protein
MLMRRFAMAIFDMSKEEKRISHGRFSRKVS